MTFSAMAFLGFLIIFLGTTLGSTIVFFFRGETVSKRMNQICVGFASGIMLSASVFSLLLPAIETEVEYMPSVFVGAIGLVLGALFLYGLDKVIPHLHVSDEKEEGIKTKRMKKTTKMFLAVTLHNIPEGLSVGIAFGVSMLGEEVGMDGNLVSALALAIGIGIQNLPEGVVVSISMRPEKGKKKAFLYGMFSGAVEPVAALVGLFLALAMKLVLPWALSFAAGAMIYIIVEEMVPEAHTDTGEHYGVFAFFFGFVLMMVLDVVLGG